MITNGNEVLQVYEQDKQNRQHDKNTITDRCYRLRSSSSVSPRYSSCFKFLLEIPRPLLFTWKWPFVFSPLKYEGYCRQKSKFYSHSVFMWQYASSS